MPITGRTVAPRPTNSDGTYSFGGQLTLPIFKGGLRLGRIREADSRLRESEARFLGAFEHAPIGMALVSPEGHWLKVNSELCALLGYSESEMLTRTFQDITHPDDLDADLDSDPDESPPIN